MPLRPGLFVPPPNPIPPLPGARLHLLGARGRGMRAVAMAAAAAGAAVDGCDCQPASSDDELGHFGIAVHHGHDRSHLRGRRLVATTLAPLDHPEVLAAVAEGIAHHRSDLLAALLRGRRSIAITGTHGKGTVGALIGLGLVSLGVDPGIILGLTVPQLGGSVRIGNGPIVAEVDESDGSVARIAADLTVVTNLSFDHPQYRRSVNDTLEDLAVHVAAVPPDGRVILGARRNIGSLEVSARAPVWQLGRDFRARILETDDEGARVRFSDPEGGATVARLRLRSVYLAENAALAYAALRALGYPPEAVGTALGRLTGMARRLETVGTAGGVAVVDDFGKHPACIGTTIAALRAWRPRRLHVIYQPHRHDHVSRWGRRLARALGGADRVIVLPIADRDFAPRRKLPSEWFRPFGLCAELVQDPGEALKRVTRDCRAGDVICVLGVHDELAGLARALLAALGGA